jgi:hypothetical protein
MNKDFFDITDDEEEQPLQVYDCQSNRSLELTGLSLRTYEICKLQRMGFKSESIYELLEQNTGGIEFADAV